MSRSELFQAIADDDRARAAELVHTNVHNACEADPTSGRSALHQAAASGRAAILAELLRYVSTPMGRDRQGQTVLGLALRSGHSDCVELLLSRSAQLWPDDREAVQALVASGHDRGDIATALYQRGARLRWANGSVPDLAQAEARGLTTVCAAIRQRIDDHSALVAACQSNDSARIEALLADRRVALQEVDEHGWPPLARAIEAGAVAAIDTLLAHEAPIQVLLPDRRDLTALALDCGLAIARFWVQHCNLEWRSAIPSALRAAIERGAEIDPAQLQALNEGQRDRLLSHAAWCGQRETVQRLCALGGRAGELAAAGLHADGALAEALHRAGAAVHACGRDGLPPLFLLALAEREDAAAIAARSLLQLGADPGQRHPRYGSPIEFAERCERHALTAALRSLVDVGRFRWQREARERGIERIRFAYSKADGVAFVPGRPDSPLDVGGDYDGAYPMPAARGLWMLQGSGLFERLGPRQQAILEKLARGEDFGLDEVLATVSTQQIEYRRR